jgi:ribose transport system ATP-binding protein
VAARPGSRLSESSPLLELRGIVKRFPGVLALDGVSFDVRPGEVHMLLGENGAGKSTLTKTIAGVYPPDAGEMFLNGQSIQIRNPQHAQALGISTIYQEFNLAPDMTVAENVFLGREPMSIPVLGFVDRAALRNKTRAVLATLDPNIDPDATVKTLGVAQQQTVEIAKALSLDAKLIVMDEPTAALTSREIARLFDIIRGLKARGVAIVYISHRLDEVKILGDRATVLRDGTFVATVAVASTGIDDMIRLMVGRDLKDKFPKVAVEPGEELLRVEGLTRQGVLHGISFCVRRGEILGVAGLVGSGRTEMARAIFGADPIDSGRVYLRGTHVTVSAPADAIASGIALVPEDRKRHGILACMSVRENITLSALGRFSRFGLLDIVSEAQRAQEFVSTLNIATPDLDRWVVNLSGGNQQKVVIAKWLNTNAEVFLFDEPTRGIDVGGKIEVYRLMNALVARGGAIVMISSELPEVLGMSDRILVLREGRVSGAFDRAEATEEHILHCAMRGSDAEPLASGLESAVPS